MICLNIKMDSELLYKTFNVSTSFDRFAGFITVDSLLEKKNVVILKTCFLSDDLKSE